MASVIAVVRYVLNLLLNRLDSGKSYEPNFDVPPSPWSSSDSVVATATRQLGESISTLGFVPLLT
ncbi:hypothetical protein HWV62_42578 [Athelia sp. TMB]|nr:hypothetical protein HWV62_42578 [Athelia sp. TMB]